MTRDGRVGNLNYEYPFFADLVEPRGALTLNIRSHACWYYTMLAMRARGLHAGGIENQIIQVKVGYESDSHWHESRDEEIARSVAIIYGLESPDEFLKTEWKKRAYAQAQMLGARINLDIYEVKPGVKRLQ